MRRFTSISACIACFSLLMMAGYEQAHTAKNSPSQPVTQPLTILGVKLNSAEAQSKAGKAGWLDGLEVEVKNTSGKAIRYAVINVELPFTGSNRKPVQIPLTFGQVPLPNTSSSNFEMFQAGARLNLKVRNICDKLRNQVLENGRGSVSSKDLRTNIHVVIFEDKTAWLGGQLHYQDPADPMTWIAAEELSRKNSLDNLGTSYSKASYNSGAPAPCFRTTGFHLQYCCCCTETGGEGYVTNVTFTGDPNGHVQPNLVETCCPASPGECCSYNQVAGCS